MDMKKYTKKRAKQNRTYLSERTDFIEAKRDKQGRIFCIFCGRVINGEPSLHHGLGRDDEMLLDQRFWFLAHNSCHVEEYHSSSCNDLYWWGDYIERIKHITEIIAKEELRMDKANYYESKWKNES